MQKSVSALASDLDCIQQQKTTQVLLVSPNRKLRPVTSLDVCCDTLMEGSEFSA